MSCCLLPHPPLLHLSSLQWKVAPALAAGNCCVLKPSELASVTCLELAGLAGEAGLPAGVLNVVTGLGADAGAPLRCGFAGAGHAHALLPQLAIVVTLVSAPVAAGVLCLPS